MEKIINTTKYMKAITIVLVAVAFSVILPVVASADYVDEEGYIVLDTVTPVSWPVVYDTGSNNPVVYDTGSNNSTIYGSSAGRTVSQVYSGGYSGGYSTYSAPSTYYVPTATVRSGSFSGGTNYYTPPTTYYTQPSTVVSGSFNGVSPTYYTQPVVQPIVQTVPNQVLAYTDTNPALSSNYIALDQVPYTGFTDELPMIIFISSLVLWSAILAFLFLKRKIDSQTVLATVNVNASKSNNADDQTSTNFVSQIASDNSDINKVEEYARANKVLISSDASVKLVKLSRLGQINVSEYIQSIATGEWMAIGENQISL